MKIIAQSAVPPTLPYVHLGYLAATTTHPSGTLLVAGMVLMLAGAAVVSSWGIGRMFPRLGFLGRHPVLMIVAGLGLMVSGFVGGQLAFRYGEVVYAHPEAMTHVNGMAVLRQIDSMRKEGKPVPEDLTESQFGNIVQDGWKHPMRLHVSGEAGLEKYTVLSAGPDGVFGTADDMTCLN